MTLSAARVLTWSTNLVFRHIKSLVENGLLRGVVYETQQNGIRSVAFGYRNVAEFMTARAEIVWIDVSNTRSDILATVKRHDFSRFPVCEGSLDHVIGVVHVRDLLISAGPADDSVLRKIVREPLFVPETVEAWKLVQLFRTAGLEMAFVADEHGFIEGIVTMADLVDPIIEDVLQRDDS